MIDGHYKFDDLVALLAPTLGEERARELVRGALTTLSVSEDDLASHDAIRAMELIGRTPGFVGSVSRFALARFTLKDATSAAFRPRSSTSGLRSPKNDALARHELTDLLAPTLGQEKSEEAVLEVLRRLGFPLDVFSLNQALSVLEALASSQGLVGVAARFAKAHLLMRAPKV
jgi:hypothetical protein